MSSRAALPFDPIQRAAQLWADRWGPGQTPVAMATATSVMRAQQILLAEFDAALAEFDLTFARYEALVLLTFSRAGELPMSKVGERLMVHPTSATHIVQRLEAQGLVERVPNPADGRGTLAVITPAGREAMEAGTRSLAAMGFGMDQLTTAEQHELFRLLEKVRRAAGDFAAPGSECEVPFTRMS